MQRGLSIAAERLTGLLANLSDQEWKSFERPEYWAHGGVQQRDRIERVASWATGLLPGHLVEIGCHAGGTTVRLAKIARACGRQVIAIDPWQPGTQDCRGGEYEMFMENTAAYQDITRVIRLPSQDETAREILRNYELCFVFVDGQHTYDAALIDILSVAHAGVIAVDDILWNVGVRTAFVEGARRTNKTPATNILWREGYLLSDDVFGRCVPGQPE